MKNIGTKIVLGLDTVLFAVFGLLYCLNPVGMAAGVGISLSDPGAIIDTYGADTARWFMLSDSPPERDLEWTDAGAAGAFRFLQRVWRLIDETADIVEAGRRRGLSLSQTEAFCVGIPEPDAIRLALCGPVSRSRYEEGLRRLADALAAGPEFTATMV